MKIIIAGSGDTGTHLAKMLAFERQDVVLVSGQKEYLESIDSTYNLMTLHGDPCSPSVLKEAGVKDADLFIGVTPNGSHNMVACQLADIMGAKNTVARVETEEYNTEKLKTGFESKGIGCLVYPEALVADDILSYLERNWVLSWHELHEGKILFAGVIITAQSPVAGQRLMDFAGKGRRYHVAGIRRRGKLIIPRGDDTLEIGDTAYFTGMADSAGEIALLAGQKEERIHDIMISGDGALVDTLLKRICRTKCEVTYLSEDRNQCLHISEAFPDITVSNSAAKDISALREEGIQKMDAFIALGNDASANIVACMVAKEMGVKRSIAQIEDLQYMAEGGRLGIDKVVNKKLITSGMILQSILGSRVRVNTVLALADMEVAEIEVEEGSRISGSKVMELDLPVGVTLGAMVRNGEGMLIEGRTRLEKGDLVMVVFLPGALARLEKLFASKNLFR